MNQTIDLSRFTSAHEYSFQAALKEIRSGRKNGHWMWFIFPQIQGLGETGTSHLYAIRNLDEAAAFLRDPYLGGNLIEISRALLELKTNNVYDVLPRPDNLKLRSSMTLFSLVPGADPVFQEVLDKFYGGKRDGKTLKKLGLR